MNQIAELHSHKPSMTVLTVAANVRAEVARFGLTDASFAADLGMTPMSMSRRLSGQTPFTIAELDTIATYFAVPVGDFFVAKVNTKKAPTPEGEGLVHPLGLEPRTHWLVDGLAHGKFGERTHAPAAYAQPHPLDARRQVRPIVKLHDGKVA